MFYCKLRIGVPWQRGPASGPPSAKAPTPATIVGYFGLAASRGDFSLVLHLLFQASSAIWTFSFAVSAVNGGSGGRVSTPAAAAAVAILQACAGADDAGVGDADNAEENEDRGTSSREGHRDAPRRSARCAIRPGWCVEGQVRGGREYVMATHRGVRLPSGIHIRLLGRLATRCNDDQGPPTWELGRPDKHFSTAFSSQRLPRRRARRVAVVVVVVVAQCRVRNAGYQLPQCLDRSAISTTSTLHTPVHPSKPATMPPPQAPKIKFVFIPADT